MSKVSVVLVLAVAAGCVPAGPPEGATLSGYTVVVTNEWTDVLAVAVLPRGPRVTLNPGDHRTLRLSRTEGVRYRIAVRNGRHAYHSGIFIPSRARPCSVLRINYHPRYVVPAGPMPCSE